MTSAQSVIYNLLYTAKELCCLCYSEVENDFIRIHDDVFFPEMQDIRTIEFQDVVAYILGNETADLMLPSEAVCKQCTQSCIQSYIFIRRCKKNYKAMPDMIQKFLSNVDSFTLGCYKSVAFAVDVQEGVTNVCYCDKERITNKETLLKKLEHGIMKNKDNSIYLSDESEESTKSKEQETPATEAKDKKTAAPGKVPPGADRTLRPPTPLPPLHFTRRSYTRASEEGSGASEKPARKKAKPDSDMKIRIKKPMNAFMLYLKEMRKKVVEESGKAHMQAINQIMGSRWHSLSPEEQEPYFEKAKQERQLHKQKYPHWHSQDNYKRRNKYNRRRGTKVKGGGSRDDPPYLKKCRAVYGLDQQNQWCKSCRRKKRCIRDKEASEEASGAMPLPMETTRFEKDVKLEEMSDASSVEETDLPKDYLRWFINDL